MRCIRDIKTEQRKKVSGQKVLVPNPTFLLMNFTKRLKFDLNPTSRNLFLS